MQVSHHVLFPFVEAAGSFKTLILRIVVKDKFFKKNMRLFLKYL